MYSPSGSKIKLTIFSFLTMFAISLPSFCEAKITGDTNPYFNKLSPIYKAYYQEIAILKDKYRAAKTKQDKAKIKDVVKEKRENLKYKIKQFCSDNQIIGSNIPFEVVGDLPFTVQQLKVNMVTHSRMEFIIKIKINQDIQDAKGKIEQRTNVYFAAFDKDDNLIKGTDNWATNDGWIKLLAGTIYDAQGHWNANRLQNMRDFKYLKIMPKSEYDKM